MFKSQKSKITSIVIGGILLVGSVAGVAFADSNSQSTSAQPKAAFYQEFVSDFATNLGVSQDQVTAALDATKKQILNEAVQQGKLSQAQADKMATSKGFGSYGFGFSNDKEHNFKGKDFKGEGRNLDGVANSLGITTDQLKTELQSGKKIQDIVTEHGMTADQFRQKMLELKKYEISKAVTDGKMTQDQANKILQRMEQHFNNPGSNQDKQPAQ